MNGLGKSHNKKNPIKKIEKTVKIKVKLPHVNKKTTSDKMKFDSNKKVGLEFTMKRSGKSFIMKSNPNNRKNSKNQRKTAACEQNTTSEKANFCSNTVCSLLKSE